LYRSGVLLTAFALMIGALSGLVAGGRLRNLSDVDLRWTFVPWGWLFASVFADRIGGNGGFYVFLAGMACLVLFAFANLSQAAGMKLIFIGALINLFMTVNNHGMPYSVNAMHNAGVLPQKYNDQPKVTVASHPQRRGDQLVLLGDVIPVPPLKIVVSIGDVIVALGFAMMAANSLTGRRGRRSIGASVPRHVATATPTTAESSVHVSLPVSQTNQPPVLEPTANVASKTHDSNDVWQARVDLLRLTDDPSVLIDLSGGSAHDANDVMGAHVVAQALRSASGTDDIPDAQIRALVVLASRTVDDHHSVLASLSAHIEDRAEDTVPYSVENENRRRS
jgi:Family of unknown function (DUF5317)